jgi:hypothetical protein
MAVSKVRLTCLLAAPHRGRQPPARPMNSAISGNSVRLHSKLGNLSPIAFEHQSATKKPIAVSEKT